jgi:hypothetical protein
MKRITFNDFSGGIAADGVILNDRQVADAHGFVLDDQRRLRSQPAIDIIGNPVDGEITKFVTGQNTWLLVRGVSSIAYMRVPAQNEAEGGTVYGTWNYLIGVSGSVRIVGQIRYNDNNTVKPALLAHIPPLNDATAAGSSAFYIFETSNGSGLTTVPITSYYPNLTLRDNEYFGESSAVPRCGVATMWKDIPVYANVQFPGVQSNDWYKDNNFNASTAKTYGNYLYFGHAFNNGWVDPRYPHRVSDDGTQIVAAYEVDEGLLCFTTGTTNSSGVILLRGTPADFTVDAVETAVNERITGLVPSQAFENSLGRGNKATTYWDEQQSVLFVTEDGRLMQYRTGRLADISPQTANVPVVVGSSFTRGSSVAAAGRYVFYADSKSRTVWVMRSYGTEGAWTRLRMPNGEPFFGSFVEAAGDVYWLHNTATTPVPLDDTRDTTQVCVARMLMTEQEKFVYELVSDAVMPGVLAPKAGRASRRGEIFGARPTLRLVSRTVGEDSPNVEKWWERITLRVLRGSSSPATVVQVTTTVQDPNEDVVAYTETVNDELTRPAETVVVNSIGPAAVAQFAVDVTGDIIIDSVSVEYELGVETL